MERASLAAAAAAEVRKWHVQSDKLRGVMKLSKHWSRWTNRASFQGTGLMMNPRVTDLLNTAVAWHMFKKKVKFSASEIIMKETVKDVFVDVSQGHDRRPWTKGANLQVSPCFTTSTCMYSCQHDRYVYPQEMARMLGWNDDVEKPPGVSLLKYRDMLGNSIALPCLGAVVWTLYIIREGVGV